MLRSGFTDRESGYCSFPKFLQDVEATDRGRQRRAWISRTLYAGATDSWTRRTVVTISAGRMTIEHRLHASCRWLFNGRPLKRQTIGLRAAGQSPKNTTTSVLSLWNLERFISRLWKKRNFSVLHVVHRTASPRDYFLSLRWQQKNLKISDKIVFSYFELDDRCNNRFTSCRG